MREQGSLETNQEAVSPLKARNDDFLSRENSNVGQTEVKDLKRGYGYGVLGQAGYTILPDARILESPRGYLRTKPVSHICWQDLHFCNSGLKFFITSLGFVTRDTVNRSLIH